jgi:ribose 5-phosphate isomerase B
MNIAIGSDHKGYHLKLFIIEHLESAGHIVRDYGADSDARTDYPVYGRRVAESIATGANELGVLICGTGIGISLAANKVPGVRAAVCSEPYSARMARAHNDAQVIAFGARVVGEGTAVEIVDAFMSAAFEGGRHTERVQMIEAGRRAERANE